MNKKSSLKDYNEFLNTQEVSVPSRLTDNIFKSIKDDFNPSPFSVFSKVSLIHFLVGGTTLFFCPQFGISLTSHSALMHFFMQWGDFVCMLACGSFFISFSFIVAALSLRPEEVRVLKKNSPLQIALLTTLSIGFFLSLGGEVVLTLGLFWALGSLLGGIISLNLTWTLREFYLKKSWA